MAKTNHTPPFLEFNFYFSHRNPIDLTDFVLGYWIWGHGYPVWHLFSVVRGWQTNHLIRYIHLRARGTLSILKQLQRYMPCGKIPMPDL